MSHLLHELPHIAQQQIFSFNGKNLHKLLFEICAGFWCEKEKNEAEKISSDCCRLEANIE